MSPCNSSRILQMVASAALVFWLAAGPLESSEPAAEAEPEVKEIKLVLHPAPEPRPALKYRLLPGVLDRKPGNAAVLYNKIAIRFGDLNPPKHAKQFVQWAGMPPDELPLDEIEGALAEYRDVLDDLDEAARYEDCDWQLPLRERDAIMNLRLPEVQSARHFAWLLAVQARVQIARGNFDEAIRTLQTGYALARHLAEGPTLVNALVARAVAGIMGAQVMQWIQQPEAPNLYWALATLPRPLVDARRAIETDVEILCLSMPELRNLDDPTRSAEGWAELWQQLTERIERWHHELWNENGDTGPPQPPPWRRRLEATRRAFAGYPMAKRGLVERGWDAERVERMPVAQVALIYTVQTYEELRDDVAKWAYLPYVDGYEGFRDSRRDFWSETYRREILPLARLLAPTINSAFLNIPFGQRSVEVMRTLEALRLYGAAHDGRLPESLDLTEVPIPVDPIAGKPFVYRLEGQTAILEMPSHPMLTKLYYYKIEFAR